QTLDVRVGDLHAFHAKTAGDLRKLARELAAHLAQVAQFLVVVAQEARVHEFSARLTARKALAPPRGAANEVSARASLLATHVANGSHARFDIDVGGEQKLERHRLVPHVASDDEAQAVVLKIEARLAIDLDGERLRVDARLELDNRQADGGFERAEMHRRYGDARERGNPEINYGVAGLGSVSPLRDVIGIAARRIGLGA